MVTMLSALVSAALLFSACYEVEIAGTVTKLGPNETYSVSDTAIVYNFHNDSTIIALTFRMLDDTVRSSHVHFIFDDIESALAYYNSYAADLGISDMQLDGLNVTCNTDTYDRLAKSTVLDVILQTHLYSNPLWPFSPKTFTAHSFDELTDGMRVIPAHTKSKTDNYIFDLPSLACPPSSTLQPLYATYAPWRLHQHGTGWVIELGDNTYLRRCGNVLLPTILTGTTDLDDATVWHIDNSFVSIIKANYWTIYSPVQGSGTFFGLSINAKNELQATQGVADIFTFLNASVPLHFWVRDTIVRTDYALWGTSYSLPDYEYSDSASVFIGWNTTRNTLEGYLPPGTTVEADNRNYYAVFVRRE